MNYSSTYKGSGRSGMIYTTSSARMTSIGGGGSMAQAPVASMGSTSSSIGRGITTSTMTSTPQVHGIYTAASKVSGGVMAGETQPQANVPGRRNAATYPLPDGACPHCQWEWVDDLYGPGFGGYVCTECGADILGGCQHDPCHCDVPLTDGWQVWLFLTILAGAYAIYKARARKKTC